MYVMYEKIYNARFLQPKQSRVRSRCYGNDVTVSVGSRSDNVKEFHSFGAQAAKLRGPKVEVRQASTCKSARAAEKWQRLVGPTSCNGNAQLSEEGLLWCGLMATLEGD